MHHARSARRGPPRRPARRAGRASAGRARRADGHDGARRAGAGVQRSPPHQPRDRHLPRGLPLGGPSIDECRGPAVVVFAGDVFDLRDGTDVESALLAHPRLSAALATFVGRRRHRLVVLPGIRDSALALRSARDRRGHRIRRRGRARLRARGRHRRRLPARARRARPSARSVGGVRRSPRPQRPPAGAASRARDRPEHREREGFEHVARRHRRARRPQPGRRSTSSSMPASHVLDPSRSRCPARSRARSVARVDGRWDRADLRTPPTDRADDRAPRAPGGCRLPCRLRARNRARPRRRIR